MQGPTRLESGIRLFSEVIPECPSFSAALWFPMGSRNEAPRAEGFFHFLEHMLFKGTRFRTARKLWEDLERTGGSANGFTDRDSLCLQISLPSAEWETGLAFLLECAFASILPEEEFERERAVILSELLQIEDDLEESAFDSFLSLFWDGHPASRPITGRPEAVRLARREDMALFASQIAVPSKAYITVTGSIDPERLRLRIDEELARLEPMGGWPETPQTTDFIIHPPVPEPRPISRFRTERRAAQVYVFDATQIPSPRTMEEYVSLWATNALLGEGTSSRLFRTLREERGLVYSVLSSLGTGQAESLLLVQASCSGENLVACVEAIEEELATLLSEGPGEEELQHLLSRLSGSFELSREDPESRLRRMGHWALSLGSLPNPDEEAKMYRQLDRTALKRALDAIAGGTRGRYAFGRISRSRARRAGFEQA